MSKVKRISVTNLKAIGSLEADFNGCTAIVTAGNNKGKTSFLKSLMDRMRSIKADRILKEGTEEGEYVMELTTGEKFIWTFKGKAGSIVEKMRFVTEKNINTSLTKEICGFYFPKVFDIDKFLEDEPSKQRATLEKLAGIDFTEIDRELKAAKEDRTFQNRNVEEQRARLGTFDPKMSEKYDEEKIKTLEYEMSTAAAHNEKIKGMHQRVSDKEIQIKNDQQRLIELRKQVKDLEEFLMAEETKLDAGKNMIKKPEYKIKDAVYMADLENRIANVRSENKRITENNVEREKDNQFEKTKMNAETADQTVKKLEKDKVDAVKNAANLPDGFGFNDSGITYNGYEFNKQQLSLSGIYIAALKLASVGLGEVKTLHFEASALDKNSLLEIQKWAATQGLQLLIERPDFEGGEIEYSLIDETK